MCFWDFCFQLLFCDIGFFFAERRLLSTLNFLLCFPTNLNVLLAICMLFCFLEGLWDDLNLERLSIKTNDLVQRKDMMFLSLPPILISLRTHGSPKNSKFCPTDFPWRLAPRADASSCQSNLSGEICRTSFGTFFGGEEGYGIQNCVWKDFFVSSDFCCWDENYFLFQKKSIGGPVLQITFMTSISSIHHWWHQYF